MIPVVFSGNRGWLHLPLAETSCRQAIVFFPAFGVEDLATRHSLACLAVRLAESGHSVLRFDLPGSGDSLGEGNEVSLASWIEAGQQAIDALQQWCGATSVCLLGLRLGGLIASLLAQELQRCGRPVAGLALLAPVLNGRQYVRELQALGNGSTPLTVAGFPVSDALRQAIAGISPEHFAQPVAPRIFLGVPSTGKHLANLETEWRNQATVEAVPYPDLAEHIGNPTFSQTPDELFEQVHNWFDRLPTSTSSTAQNTASITTSLAGENFVEDGEILAIENGLAGVWCTPLSTQSKTPIVVFCNAGRNPHIGWARSSVSLARRLAQNGIASLRFDLAGLGDSLPMASPPGELLYSKAGLPQLRAVLDAVDRRHGPERSICLVGACSGGYLAFHGAKEDKRIRHLVLVNVQRFIWEEGMSLQASMRTGGRSTQAYRQRAFSPETWKRLLQGDINLAEVSRVLALRGWDNLRQRVGHLGRHFSGTKPEATDTPSTIRQDFADLAARGTQSVVVYSEEDGGRDEFARYFGVDSKAFTRLPGARQVIIPDTDHDLTPIAAREKLLSEILATCLPAGPSGGDAKFQA